VAPIAEHDLQGVLARWKLDQRFSLAAAEMQVLLVRRDGVLQLLTGDGFIDQQVMMAGLRLFHACGRHAHPGQSELDQQRTRNSIAVLQVDEVDLRSWCRRCITRNSCTACQ
jgi:hypothetical protein